MTEPETPEAPERFRPADAFDGTDPVALAELSPEQRAWRVVLHLLAEHGDTAHFPTALAPDPLVVEVAAGWNYRPTFTESGGVVTLSAVFTGWNPNDPAGNFQPGSPFYDRTATTGTAHAAFARAADAEVARAVQAAHPAQPPTVGHWPGTVEVDPAEIAEEVARVDRGNARLREQEEGREDPTR